MDGTRGNRLITLLLALLLGFSAFALTACGRSSAEEVTHTQEETDREREELETIIDDIETSDDYGDAAVWTEETYQPFAAAIEAAKAVLADPDATYDEIYDAYGEVTSTRMELERSGELTKSEKAEAEQAEAEREAKEQAQQEEERKKQEAEDFLAQYEDVTVNDIADMTPSDVGKMIQFNAYYIRGTSDAMLLRKNGLFDRHGNEVVVLYGSDSISFYPQEGDLLRVYGTYLGMTSEFTQPVVVADGIFED